MYIIRFTQFFQLTKNSKNLTFLFLPNANLTPDFQKAHCFPEISTPRPRALLRTHKPPITISTHRQFRGDVENCAPSGYDVLRWHSPGDRF